MHKLSFVLIFVFCVACSKSKQEISRSIPSCIQAVIEDPDLSKDIKTVRVQENASELQYWINTDFTHFDGVEYILNSTCDTVCIMCGECLPPECLEDYSEEWLTIWEK